MTRTYLVIALALASQLLAGCPLETRSAQKEQEEKQVQRKQLSTLQQNFADINMRFQDLEEGSRRTNGRIDGLDNKIQQSTAKTEKANAALELKAAENNNAYREEFKNLRSEIDLLKGQIAKLQEDQERATTARAESDARAAKESAKDPYQLAEEKFAQGNFQEAILDYERYRKAHPKGKKFAAATYKIGASFGGIL